MEKLCMTKRLIIALIVTSSLWACEPYVSARLPIGSANGAIEYRVIPLHAETIQLWSEARTPEKLMALGNPSQPLADYDYILGPGDYISLIIYTFDAKGEQSAIRVFPEGLPIAGEDEFLVAADGTATLPYVGRIYVQGKPFATVNRMIERGLRRYFIEPQFQARISRFAHGRVLVTGEVGTPGEQMLSHSPLSVTSAIEAAGGLLPTADLHASTLTRANGLRVPLDLRALYYEGDTAANQIIQPGDRLTIARGEANQVFVAGEVLRPQVLVMHPNGANLPEMLQQAGGINPVTGDPSDIYVLRVSDTAKTPQKTDILIYHLDASNLANMALATQFNMHSNDIIYVSQQPITTWDRTLSQFLPGGLSTIVGPQFSE
jgi:polysaccharide export outer membrane protein